MDARKELIRTAAKVLEAGHEDLARTLVKVAQRDPGILQRLEEVQYKLSSVLGRVEEEIHNMEDDERAIRLASLAVSNVVAMMKLLDYHKRFLETMVEGGGKHPHLDPLDEESSVADQLRALPITHPGAFPRETPENARSVSDQLRDLLDEYPER